MNTVTKKNSFLVTGDPGVGKSYFIRNEAKNQKAKLFRWNVRIDRSLREGREILHTQVRSKEKLYVWIEGADDLTQEAQAFLRRILETASSNVTSMLEVRETWKLSQPIISRCVPICISRNKSFRSERAYQLAKNLHLYNEYPDIDVNTLSLKDIIILRKKAYDPISIIYKLIHSNSLTNKDILNMF
jgi:DNA polymerase III delta prime subunit